MTNKVLILNNVETLLSKHSKKINTDKKLLLAYWNIFDKIDMKNGIVVDDFLSKATDPTHILQAKEMLKALEQSKFEEEGWN